MMVVGRATTNTVRTTERFFIGRRLRFTRGRRFDFWGRDFAEIGEDAEGCASLRLTRGVEVRLRCGAVADAPSMCRAYGAWDIFLVSRTQRSRAGLASAARTALNSCSRRANREGKNRAPGGCGLHIVGPAGQVMLRGAPACRELRKDAPVDRHRKKNESAPGFEDSEW
jgi:hypothetical protein